MPDASLHAHVLIAPFCPIAFAVAAGLADGRRPPVCAHRWHDRRVGRVRAATCTPKSCVRPLRCPITDIAHCVCVCRLRFDVRLLQRVPYEGISRMQTSLRRFVASPN